MPETVRCHYHCDHRQQHNFNRLPDRCNGIPSSRFRLRDKTQYSFVSLFLPIILVTLISIDTSTTRDKYASSRCNIHVNAFATTVSLLKSRSYNGPSKWHPYHFQHQQSVLFHQPSFTNSFTKSEIKNRKISLNHRIPRILPCRLHATNLNKSNDDYSERESDDDDEDDDEEDYIDLTNVDTTNIPKSISTTATFGPGRGRSAPSQRKAMGRSTSGSTTVYVCTNCASEFVNWFGRCPTCRQWNTVQEFKVGRSAGGSNGAKPVFGSSSGKRNHRHKPQSWLSGIEGEKNINEKCGSSSFSSSSSDTYQPVPITEVYKRMGYKDSKSSEEDDGESSGTGTMWRDRRIKVPNDDEVNNVLGGGIMPGSLLLLGGDPGVGKSTLLLQIAGSVASLSTPPRGIGMGMNENSGEGGNDLVKGPVLYVSGEETAVQIASRASRLGIEGSELLLLCETDADFISETVAYAVENDLGDNALNLDDNSNDDKGKWQNYKKHSNVLNQRKPSLVIIDSIQTMHCESAGSSRPGGVTQVRECVALFLRLAKSTSVPIILVGHVTKSGGVAGPRTVEHMVDTVLYLEGGGSSSSSLSSGYSLRMLRAAKNRFGSSDEVGVYEMTGGASPFSRTNLGGGRLVPVSDPSSFFLENRMDAEDMEGCAISLVLEGMRAMTVEVQALASAVGGGTSFSGRRTVDGISTSRLLLILAVLQKRCGLSFHKQDVYVNVAGGIQLNSGKKDGSESDLSVAIALVSSLINIPVRADTAFVGEIGLLGELRSVPNVEKRVKEARRMGFSRIVVPMTRNNGGKNKKKWQKKSVESSSSSQLSLLGIEHIECKTLLDAINKGLVERIPKKSNKRKENNDNSNVSIPDFNNSNSKQSNFQANRPNVSTSKLSKSDFNIMDRKNFGAFREGGGNYPAPAMDIIDDDEEDDDNFQ